MFKGVKSRFDFLLPLLDENKVAYKIIKAVRKNRALLKMPRFTYTMPLLRLLPTSALDAVGSFLGINNSMDDFEGRKDK